MRVISTALTATYSSVLSLQGLDTNGPLGFGVSVGETSTDTFVLYGTLDSAAVDNANAQDLGEFSGGAGNLPAGIAAQARSWPFVLVRRTGGSTAGNFFVAGNPAASPAVVSTAAPAGTAYSAVMTLTTLGAQSIRIGGSAAMTASDVFDVFLSNDSTIASSTGAFYAGQITGGGGSRLISVLVSGYNYAIIQRVSGSTAGNIIAAGVSPSAGGGVLNLTVRPVGDTAVNGPIGALTAAQTVDVYSAFLLTQTTAGVTATLRNPTDTTAGKVALVINNDASAQSIVMYGENLPIGSAQWFTWDGSAWVGGQNVTQGGNAFGAALDIRTLDAQNVNITALTSGATSVNLASGSGGITMLAQGNGPVSIQPGATGSVWLLPRAAGAGNTSQFRFYELAASGTDYVSLQAPDSLAAPTAYVLPNAFPTVAGQQLESSATGTMSWGGMVNVSATNTSAQNFSDGGGDADVINWTTGLDTAGAFVAATGVFTVPAGQGGLYIITVGLQFANTAAALGVTFSASVAVNTVNVRTFQFVNPVAALTQTRTVGGTFLVQLTAGQTVNIHGAVSANGGTDIALTNSALFNTLSISRISA